MTGLRQTRHSGIELARIVAMFLIVTMHVNTQGGILNSLIPFSANDTVEWLLMCVTYCAVDCYALISGYMGVTSNFRYRKMMTLWLQVAFYTVLITGAFAIFVPGSVGIMEWVKAITPASSGQYWYFSAYFAMFFFIPFLNYLLNGLDPKNLKALGLTIIVIFSIIPTVRHTDPFFVDRGYTTIWLMSLYLIGGILRKENLLEKFNGKVYFVGFWICALLAWGSKVLIESICFRLTGEVAGGGVLVSNISTVIILQAICLLGMFLKVHITNKTINKVICTIAGTTFSVFVIHEHPLLKYQFLKGRFASYAEETPIIMVLKVLGTALVIFAVCSVIDLVRMQIFRVLRVKEHCDGLCEKMDKQVKKLLGSKAKG